jgi:uncharacterized membrane protein
VDFEFLFFLGIALLAVLPVALVLGVVGFVWLSRRISRLEQELAEALRGMSGEAHDVGTGVPDAGAAGDRPDAAAPPRDGALRPPSIPVRAGEASGPRGTAADAQGAARTGDGPAARVSGRGGARATGEWVRQNWVYLVSAASLALAGVFFVQYGVEAGLLPPVARVAAGIVFGAGLIAAGEAMRRRVGDAGAARYLPQVFSGAGLVSAFASVVAARLMYGLIGPEATFAALAMLAVGAVLLGWRNGPLLVAVGLIGAAAAPLLTGGGREAAPWLYAHYGLVASIGLAVDAFRRWGWVSALALALGYVGAALMFAAGAGAPGLAVLLAAMPCLAALLPGKALFPEHPGTPLLLALWRRGRAGGWPDVPVRLAFGAMAVSVPALVALGQRPTPEALLALALLGGLALVFLTWAERARALEDLPFLPAAGALAVIGLAGWNGWPLMADYAAAVIGARMPESAPPLTVSAILGGAALVSAAFARRALAARDGAAPMALAQGMAAALVAPMAAAVFEMLWAPAPVLGPYPWALHAMALAAGATWLALRFARHDAPRLQRAAHAALAALSLVALALFVLTTKAALTLALSVLLVVAAVLDRRFRLPEMGAFIQLGILVLTWRLLVDPGLDWALDAALSQVLAAHGGAIAAALAAWWHLRGLDRPATRAALGAAAMVFAAMLANVLAGRVLDGREADTHWALSLQALPWLLVALAQASLAGRAPGDTRATRWLRRARWALAAIAGLVAATALALAVSLRNPLFAWSPEIVGGRVIGPPVFDSLAIAYLVPGLVLAAAGLWAPGFGMVVRRLCVGAGAAFAALYAGLEIRRLWQGPFIGGPDVLQGELYSYTLAMLVTGAVMLVQAHRRRRVGLRRAAMAVIALTVAKVFLIDISGLSGLVRVASFLGLGLSLAALAWLNRWVGAGRPDPQPQGAAPDDSGAPPAR